MAENIETRISSEHAKEAIYQAHLNKDAIGKINGLQSSASEIDAGIAKANSIQDISDIVAGLTVTGGEISEAVPLVTKKANLTYGRNIFNVNALDNEVDKFINATNGLVVTSTSYKATGYIKIDGATTYSMSFKHNIAWYDKNKVFIIGSSSANTNKTQTSPSNAKYLRCTVQNANWTFFQVEVGTLVTTFTDYIDPYVTLGYTISPLDTKMFERTSNLFDKTTAKQGYFVNWTNGTLSSNSTYTASNYIEISPSTQYIMSGYGNINYLAWYDSNYVFISGNQTGTFPLTSPVNAKYIKVTVITTYLDTAQLEVGTVATAYSNPYRLKSFYGQKSLSNWYGKTWATLGDSITAGLSWQPKVVIDHNLLLVNGGIGGSKISGSSIDSFAEGTRVANMPSNADIISVMGGTNDWAQNVVLGTINDTGTTTFYGALNTLVQLLLAKYPTKRIILMTTPYGEMLDHTTRGWVNKTTNSQGLTTFDYANAVKQICIKYKIPCIDIHNEAGWNMFNITNYLINDGNLLHPNALGASRISNIVSDALNRL